MTHYHRDIFKYEVPDGWYVGYEQEYLQIYNEEDGLGALTASFYVNLKRFKRTTAIAENMAKSFIDQHHVELFHPMKWHKISDKTNVLIGEGIKGDSYIKIWVIVDHLRIVVATYFSGQHFDKNQNLSPELTSEVAIFDTIINSVTFIRS